MRAERDSTLIARHPIKRLMATFAALIMAVTALPAGANVNSDSNASSRTLVILGAFYAGSWGTPPLPGYSVVNRGVGGEQTKGMRARFERDVAAAYPGAVLIWGHVSNITQAEIVGASPHRIDAIKKAARASGIEVMLATEIPMADPAGLVNQARALVGRLMGKQSYADQVNAQVRNLNAFVRQLAAREKLRPLDFEKVFAPYGGTRIEEYAQPDRSHVTPADYQALTEYAVAELGKRR